MEMRSGKQLRPFKVKEILPQQKTVDIKKWAGCKNNKGQVQFKIFFR